MTFQIPKKEGSYYMKRMFNPKHVSFFVILIISLFTVSCDVATNDNSTDLASDTGLEVNGLISSIIGPSGLAFYTPPSPLPTGNHGDLISYRKTAITLPGAPAVYSWTIMYLSTDATGKANAVTGTVLVPKKIWSWWSRRPIISYAVGTHGLCQSCAPSIKLAEGTDYEISNIVRALNKNYAVLISDNPGYTTDDIPTYMAGIAQGHAVLDIVKAASQVPYSTLSSRAEVAVWGYSQGGQSASFAGQLQPSYTPDMNLVGVAAGGVPADFFDVAEYLDGNNGSGFLLATVIGLWSQYPEGIPLETLVNSTGELAIQKGLSTCVFEALFAFMNTSLSTYVEGGPSLDELLSIPSVHETLLEQDLGNSSMDVPLFLYHGTSDEFIPLEQSLKLKEKYCGLGVKTTYMVFPGEHITTQFQAAPYVLSWIEDRFDGRSAECTCDTDDPRPVSTANPVDGDFIFSLDEWTLNGTIHLNTLDQDVELPEGSTFTADTNMTSNSITGTLSVPTFPGDIWVILPLEVTLTIAPAAPMDGTASLDKDGILHVHGNMPVNLYITQVGAIGIDVPFKLHTVEPINFPIDFDGPVSSLGDGSLTFSGTTTFPKLTGNGIAINTLFTSLMSGPGQEYTFTVTPPEPKTW